MAAALIGNPGRAAMLAALMDGRALPANEVLISAIVGTWRLTSFTEQNLETGAISYPFGEGAKALVIYEGNGYVADHLHEVGSEAATWPSTDRPGGDGPLPERDRLRRTV